MVMERNPLNSNASWAGIVDAWYDDGCNVDRLKWSWTWLHEMKMTGVAPGVSAGVAAEATGPKTVEVTGPTTVEVTGPTTVEVIGPITVGVAGLTGTKAAEVTGPAIVEVTAPTADGAWCALINSRNHL